MHTRPIGSLEVPVIGLGCNNFGRRVDEAGTARVVDAAIDAGVTLFDTAEVYGDGDSEAFLGRALRGRRDRVVIATKFGHPSGGVGKGARPEHVRPALEGSLRRLQTDHVDLYQLHRPDPEVPISDTLGALDELVREGLVREIGCSNFTSEQLEEADAVQAGRQRFVSVQNEYSLLHREPEAEVLPACRHLGLAFIPYFPLKSGLLTGKYRADRPLPEGARLTGAPRFESLLSAESLEQVERLAAFAEARGREILDLAFAWLLSRDLVASVIAGATSPDQVRRNARAAEWTLSTDEVAAVEELIRPEGTPKGP
jgi:aryl-alcohol dehydrogenase-like predicted oxidoreductase